jgi:hypothetical protein
MKTKSTSASLFLPFMAAALVSGYQPAQALECPVIPATDDETPTMESPYDEGIFFRVSKGDLPASHVLGTMHVSDARVIEKTSRARDLVAESDRLLLELDLSNETMEIITEASFYHDGTTLDQAVGADLAEASIALLREYGIPTEIAMSMKPWAVFSSLAMPPDTGIPLDMQLMAQAREAGVDIAGIETPLEQISALSTLAEDEHALVLLATVCDYEHVQLLLEDMIELYLDSDLAGLARISDEPSAPEIQALVDKLNEALVKKRNVVMVERLVPMLDIGNQFVAIGALHLIGEDGILNQLAQRGFTIEKLE